MRKSWPAPVLLMVLAVLLVSMTRCHSLRGASPGPLGAAEVPPSSPPTRQVQFNNNCSQTIWVGSLGNAVPGCNSSSDCPGSSICVGASGAQAGTCQCPSGTSCGPGLVCDTSGAVPLCEFPPAANGGFALDAGAQGVSVSIPLVSWTSAATDAGTSSPPIWGGRFWPRTGCDFSQPTCSTDSDCTQGSTRCVGGSCLPGCGTNADCTSVSTNAICFGTNGDAGSGTCLPHPACQTGDCNGLLSCAPGSAGIPPVALAEFFLISVSQPPPGVGSDFYDVSNVDGYAIVPGADGGLENIGMRIRPVSGSFQPPTASGTCQSDSDCTWPAQCAPQLGQCINAHDCGSPGCVSTSDCALRAADAGTLLQPAAWNLDTSCGRAPDGGGYPELAVVAPTTCSSTQPCPGSATCNAAGVCECSASSQCGPGLTCGATQFFAGFQACGQFIGCASAEKACAMTCPSRTASDGGASCGPAALQCTTLGNPGSATGNLYGCVPNPSCYTNGVGANCCGCPDWTPTSRNSDTKSNGQLCQSHNPSWEGQPPERYARAFHDAAPTAYSYAFDDAINLMTCTGLSDSNNVLYEVTFCPQSAP